MTATVEQPSQFAHLFIEEECLLEYLPFVFTDYARAEAIVSFRLTVPTSLASDIGDILDIALNKKALTTWIIQYGPEEPFYRLQGYLTCLSRCPISLPDPDPDHVEISCTLAIDTQTT